MGHFSLGAIIQYMRLIYMKARNQLQGFSAKKKVNLDVEVEETPKKNRLFPPRNESRKWAEKNFFFLHQMVNDVKEFQ